MSFFVSQKTLERLEWARVLARLEKHARTPGGRARCAPEPVESSPDAAALFEPTLHGVLQRLGETSEARGVLAASGAPPLGGVVALEASLRRSRLDGVLAARELLDWVSTLRATRETQRFLQPMRDAAPGLCDLADGLMLHPDLESDMDSSLERSGEVRDSASPSLASARRDARRLASETQKRIDHYLHDPNTAPHLSDHYYTIRNDRYVLPVRVDARSNIRGIVHDASNSGMTLFIEPEALVEINNRLKQAEIAIEQETLRVLRRLSRRAAATADEVEANLATLVRIDLAFARAHFAEELEAVSPEVHRDGIVALPQLRHPLIISDEVVPNDVRLGDDFIVLLLSGPNAGGKTVTLKAVALAALFVRAGLHVPAGEGARIDVFDEVLADIGDEQDLQQNLSTFSAHMSNLADITDRASRRSLVVLDEIGVGTDPSEGAALAQATLEALADLDSRVVATTHYSLLKEVAEVDSRFANASVEFDPETLAPTYRLQIGVPGSSSATAVAARMGIGAGVIARANELLDQDDRQLDRMLTQLAANRSALEAEQREIAHVRLETEAMRTQHREKLEQLQTRRDKLFHSMRQDLERSFRDAHEQVAGVIRELQKGGTARDAARAREELTAIEGNTRAVHEEAGLAPRGGEDLDPIDWPHAAAGDSVQIGGGGVGILLSLPDRRGRVAVRLGSARVLVPMQRVGAVSRKTPPSGEIAHEHVGARRPVERSQTARGVPVRARETPAHSARLGGVILDADPLVDHQDAAALADSDASRCDLRGLRVDEALDRLIYALDRAASADFRTVSIVHGLATGALRDAVRAYLRESLYVSRFFPAAPEEGGDGVTIAILGD